MSDQPKFEPFSDKDLRRPPPSSEQAPGYSPALRSQLQRPGIGCSLGDSKRSALLRTWLEGRLPQARFADLAGSPGPDFGLQLLVLNEASAGECGLLDPDFHGPSCPELVLVELPRHTVSACRDRGLPVAAALAEFSVERVGMAVVHALSVRLPLRILSQLAVGKVELREAVSLVRFHMLGEALRQTKSKRATARLLGVTRPAVQSMVKTLSIPEPRD